jgi:hypothetical protein
MAERLGYYRTMITPLADLCSIGLCEEPREVWDALGLDAESKSCNCGA